MTYFRYFFRSTAFLICTSGATAASSINDTTSYAKQNAYYCKLATNGGIKPAPTALDHFRMHNIHRGIADLYGDGTLEMVFGASDETFSLARAQEKDQEMWPSVVYEGNAARSRKPHQYAFYSPDTKFNAPDGTKYLNARTILTQDFNGDGIDDLAFAIWGTDYEPYLPRRNEILLSSPTGYQARYLPGSATFGHGASAGDIDNDGDVDLIITGADKTFSRSPIYRYINDGEGNFTVSKLSNLPDTHMVSLYDIDGDNKLDLFLSNIVDQTYTVKVFWGLGDGTFEATPLSFFETEWISQKSAYKRGKHAKYQHYRHRSFSEPVFTDTDNDGFLNIIIPSNMDLHFSLFDLEMNGRDPLKFGEIFRTPEAPNDGMIPELNWLNACSLQGNYIDLIYEVFGQYFYGNTNPNTTLDLSRTDKVIFKNDRKGQFSYYKLENPLFFSVHYTKLLDEYASALGVTSKSYEPAQTYYPNTINNDLRFIHPSYLNMRQVSQLLPFNTIPEISKKLGFDAVNAGSSLATATGAESTQNLELQTSIKVRCLIAARKNQSASDCKSTEKPEAKAPSPKKHTNGNWNDGASLSERAKRILRNSKREKN